ncbi:MAG: pirin family protein [Betaproteobacteria bacterium]|nr:pirin family protein [Betaproteobacteria bacterium]
MASPLLRIAPLGAPPWETPNPFLFCVHHLDFYPKGDGRLGPAASLAGRTIGQDFAGKDGWSLYHGATVPGFPQHPHRGFETVTVVRRGLVDHSDSLGAQARYGEGDVQWLTAGAGIQHAEMFPLVHEDRENTLELFQIWLNLPAADKMAPPYFAMFWADTVPRAYPVAGVEVTVVAGALGDVRPPAPPPHSYASRPESDVAIWTIRMEAGARWTMPPAARGSNRFLYFFAGENLRIAGEALARPRLVVADPEVPLPLEATDAPVELLVLQGKPIAEPVAQYGPFVMNTRAELQQAFADYERTRFGGWCWGRPDPVNGTQGRFARRPDGTVERPGP